MNTVDEAVSYAKTVRNLAKWFGVCEGNLELGEMRFDANISLQVKGEDVRNLKFEEWKDIQFTPIVEIKNMNSFGNLQEALDYEIKRQAEKYNETGEINTAGSKETRGWDDSLKKTYSQRKKEEANEYRYIPEPDIPTLVIEKEDVDKVLNKLGSNPLKIQKQMIDDGFPPQAVSSLTENRILYAVFSEVVQDTKVSDIKIANLITNELATEILSFDEKGPIPLEYVIGLGKLMKAVDSNEISNTELKQILKDHKFRE